MREFCRERFRTIPKRKNACFLSEEQRVLLYVSCGLAHRVSLSCILLQKVWCNDDWLVPTYKTQHTSDRWDRKKMTSYRIVPKKSWSSLYLKWKCFVRILNEEALEDIAEMIDYLDLKKILSIYRVCKSYCIKGDCRLACECNTAIRMCSRLEV